MFYLAAIMVLASLILGGGTSHGFLSDAILQIIAVPTLIISLWLASTKPSLPQASNAHFFCFIILLIPLLQLIPLPPDIWTGLPGRNKVSTALKLSFSPLPWMPLSLSPRETWLSFLAMLLPITVFMVVYQLSYKDRQRLSLVIIVFGIVSIFLGLLQLAQGSSSSLRFFDITNKTDSVGFFANRNHYAASLYSITILVMAWIWQLVAQRHRHYSPEQLGTTRLLYMAVGFTVVIIFFAGQLMTRSRSGLGLTMISLIPIYLMGRRSLSRKKSKTKIEKWVWPIMIVTFLFSSQFALFRIMDRLEYGFHEDRRAAFSEITIKAALDSMPFGTGLGSFAPVFQQYETAQMKIHVLYANHTHNDYLEVWLETGIIGGLMISIFLMWYVFQSYQIWKKPFVNGQTIDKLLAKSATIILGLLLIHSLVSYPLRTSALMCIFSFSCAMLIRPPTR